MKKDIHPDYKLTVFKDISNNFAFLTRSTIQAKDKIKWEDGNEYPLVKVEISSKSHPFFTGKQVFVDTAGRVDKFYQRYGGKKIEGAEKIEDENPEGEKIEHNAEPKP